MTGLRPYRSRSRALTTVAISMTTAAEVFALSTPVLSAPFVTAKFTAHTVAMPWMLNMLIPATRPSTSFRFSTIAPPVAVSLCRCAAFHSRWSLSCARAAVFSIESGNSVVP